MRLVSRKLVDTSLTRTAPGILCARLNLIWQTNQQTRKAVHSFGLSMAPQQCYLMSALIIKLNMNRFLTSTVKHGWPEWSRR